MKTLQLATLPEGIRKTWAFPKRNGPSSSTLNFQELFGQYRDVALKMNPTLHKKSTNILYVGNRSYIAFRKSCQSFTCEFSYNSQTCTKVFFFWGGGGRTIHPHFGGIPNLVAKTKKLPQLDQLDMLGIQAGLLSINNTGTSNVFNGVFQTGKDTPFRYINWKRGWMIRKKKTNDIGIYWSKNRDRDSPPLSLTTMFFFFPIFGGHETWGELEVMDVRGNSFPPSSGCNCSWLPR